MQNIYQQVYHLSTKDQRTSEVFPSLLVIPPLSHLQSYFLVLPLSITSRPLSSCLRLHLHPIKHTDRPYPE